MNVVCHCCGGFDRVVIVIVGVVVECFSLLLLALLRAFSYFDGGYGELVSLVGSQFLMVNLAA